MTDADKIHLLLDGSWSLQTEPDGEIRAYCTGRPCVTFTPEGRECWEVRTRDERLRDEIRAQLLDGAGWEEGGVYFLHTNQIR